MESPDKIVHEDETCCTRAWRSMLVFTWRRAPDASFLPAHFIAVQRFLTSSGRRWVVCSVITNATDAPDARARELLGKLLPRLDPHLTAAVSVVLGTGFRTAALRSVLSGLALLARQKHVAAFVGTLEEAAPLLVRHWPAADPPAPAAVEIAATLRRMT